MASLAQCLGIQTFTAEDRAEIQGFIASNGGDAAAGVQAYLDSLDRNLQELADQAAKATGMVLEQSSVALRTGEETLEPYGLEADAVHKTRTVAVALEARTAEVSGKIARNDRSDKARDTIAEWMVAEVLHDIEAAEAGGNSAVGWYSDKFQSALDTIAELFPEMALDGSVEGTAFESPQHARDFMTALVAITSDGEKVYTNWKRAVDLYAEARETGIVPTNTTASRGVSMRLNIALINELSAEHGAGMKDFLMQPMLVSVLNKELKVRNQGRAKKDRLGAAKYPANRTLPRAATYFGPKLGAFYANLSGAEGYLTMDRWWSRSFNRFRGDLIDKARPEGIHAVRIMILGDRAGLKPLAPGLKGKARTLALSNMEALLPDKALASLSDSDVLELASEHAGTYKAKGFKDGTALEQSSNTIYKSEFENLNDQPFNIGDRGFMIDTVEAAQVRLNDAGVDISIADIQAILWYYEKRLYAEMGARATPDVSYDEVATRIVESRTGTRPLTAGGGQSSADPSADTAGVRGASAGPQVFRGRITQPVAVYGSASGREVYEIDDPSVFHDLISAAQKDLGPVGPQVTVYDDYAGKRLFLFDGGLSGFALDGDDIISVFSVPGTAPAAAQRVMEVAVAEGGRRLDAFDTFLPRVYARAGFRAVATLPFNREFAPDGWDYSFMEETFGDGDPDVVFMIYDPANATPHTDNVVAEYDDGLAAQQQALSEIPATQGAAQQPGPGVNILFQSAVTEEDTHDPFEIVMPFRGTTPDEQLAELQEMTAENRQIVQALMADVDAEFGTESGDNVKDQAKVLQKSQRPSILAKKPWFTIGHIRDSYRFKTVISSLDQLPGIFDMALASGVSVVKVDTGKMFDPNEWGWRMVAFDLRMPNGQLVEWYLPLQELEVQKSAEGHLLFEKWRNLDPAEIRQDPATYRAYMQDIQRSVEGYNAALNAALERQGQTISEAAASFASVESSLSDAVRRSFSSSGAITSSSDRGVRTQTPSSPLVRASASEKNRSARDVPSSIRAEVGVMGSTSGSNISPDGVQGNAGQADILSQGEKAPRGRIEIPSAGVESGTSIVRLFETADRSTFLHEMFHYFLEVMDTLSRDPGATPEIRDMMAKIRKYVGNDGGKFTREQHELFSRSGEAFFMEGVAPSLELSDTFSLFKGWLKKLYYAVRGLNVELNDDIRDVFSRMMASDAAIEEARAYQAMTALFAEKPTNTSETDWQMYQRRTRRGEEQSKATLMKRMMAKFTRERKAWYKKERAAVQATVEDEVNARPEHRLIEAAANGVVLGPGGTSAEAPPFKIDRNMLVAEFGQDILSEIDRSKLGNSHTIYGPDGLAPAEVAEAFGFESAGEMMEALKAAGKRKAVIKAETDQIMDDRYGDVMNDGTIEEEAMAAVHSEQQSVAVSDEVRALARELGINTKGMTSRMWKVRAQELLAEMTLREAIRPAKFLTAERRAGLRAEREFARSQRKGGEEALTKAYIAKQEQMLNHHLYNLSRQAEAEGRRNRKKARSYEKEEVRRKIGSPHIEQIDALMERYEFRVKSKKEIENRKSLRLYIEEMVKAGREEELNIDERFIDEAGTTHWEDMTLGEMRALFDTVANLESMGKRTVVVKTKRRTRMIREEITTISELVLKAFPRGKPLGLKEKSVLQQYTAMFRDPDTMVIALDRGEEFGQAYDILLRDLMEGQAAVQAANTRLAEDMLALYDAHYTRKEFRALGKSRQIEGEARAWTGEELLSLALNSGTRHSWQRVTDQNVNAEFRMTQDRLDRLLRTLTDNDWRFVQAIWDKNDTFWDEISDVTMRRTNVRPVKEQPQVMWSGAPSFVRGGYHQIKYDPTKGSKARNDAESSWDKNNGAGHGATSMVKNGMTRARQETGGGRTLRYDLGVMIEHMTDAIRLIHLSEAVDVTGRILRSSDVVEAFQEVGRMDMLNALMTMVDNVAQGPVFNNDLVSSMFRGLKTNFSLSKLIGNLRTVTLQVTGLAQSAAIIGPVDMARGMKLYTQNPTMMKALSDEVVARSDVMSQRFTTLQKDTHDIRNMVQLASPVKFGDGVKGTVSGGYDVTLDVVSKYGMLPIVFTQYWFVDMPTFLAAEQKYLREGHSPADAQHFAERMVERTQDSGSMPTRSAIERGSLNKGTNQSEVTKLFSTLAGYMFNKMNRVQVEAIRARWGMSSADSNLDRAAIALALAARLSVLFMGEAIMMGLLYASINEDDEDDEWLKFMMEETGSALTGGLPFFRDVHAAAKGFSGGTYSSATGALGELVKQTTQGEWDRALAKALTNTIGIVTGLPSTSTFRLVDAILDDDKGIFDAMYGYNPMTGR